MSDGADYQIDEAAETADLYCQGCPVRSWANRLCRASLNTCVSIREATARGNRFRELVQRKLKAAGLPSDLSCCPMLDRILREATAEEYQGS